MKTGREIVSEILSKRNELAESGKAVDLVADELGQGTTAYKILSENHRKVRAELHDLENKEYCEPEPEAPEPHGDFFD
jgi:septation ring formation regulator EzrA